MAGSVRVDGEVVDKAGSQVKAESALELKERLPFVGRGGVKLSGALDAFGIDVAGLVAADVGASTGGFTDCLLQRGAARVFAIDVGKGLLDAALRNDARVVVLEGINIRHLDASRLGEKADIAVIDVSFISLTLVLPKVRELLKGGGTALALVKPQFEVGRGEVGKGGIVRDEGKQKKAVEKIREFAQGQGFLAAGQSESPITGAKGNREFWLRLKLC